MIRKTMFYMYIGDNATLPGWVPALTILDATENTFLHHYL